MQMKSHSSEYANRPFTAFLIKPSRAQSFKNNCKLLKKILAPLLQTRVSWFSCAWGPHSG